MANRLLRNVRTPGHGVVELVGSFRPKGASAVDVWKGIGITKVERSGAGVFKITLDDKYVELLHAELQVRLGTAAATFGQVTDVDLDDREITITVLSTSTTAAPAAADIADNAANWVYFRFVLQNSSEKQ